MPLNQLISCTPLPEYPSITAPALHTLVKDEQEILYLSDEFNHCVISLDRTGVSRWHAGGQGRAERQFWYPRGMAIGWLRMGETAQRCLGVCDAWNHRIQFLDLDGEYLKLWAKSGDRAFKEVCDIRYFGGSDKDSEGFWPVLDRGNCRLCAMDIDGELLFEIGRAYPPHLESQWDQKRCELRKIAGSDTMAADFPCVDPLYYPTKILGRTETAVYLFEPYDGRLKQALFGSLFTLPLRLPRDSEWVAASDNLFLGWNPISRNLSWLDASGKVICETIAEGKLINSTSIVSDVWMHSVGKIELWRFGEVVGAVGRADVRPSFDALLIDAGRPIVLTPLDRYALVFKDRLAASRSCIETCDQLLSVAVQPGRNASQLNAIWANFMSSWNQAICAPEKGHGHQLELAALMLQLPARGCSQPGVADGLQPAQLPFEDAIEPIKAAYIEALACQDHVMAFRFDVMHSDDADDVGICSVLLSVEQFLTGVIRDLQSILFLHSLIMDHLIFSDQTAGNNVTRMGDRIRQPRTRHRDPASCCLREVEHFELTPSDTKVAPLPYFIARTSDGHFFVSLYGRGTIVQLDAKGKVVSEIFSTDSGAGSLAGPLGLTADRQDRLWIVEHGANRVRIYSPATGEDQVVASPTARGDHLSLPSGIMPGPSGSMLVADHGNHRVASFRDTGLVEVFCGSQGTGPGELRCPVDLCVNAPDAGSGFWVVDHRNHRLQMFDWSGRFVKQVGACGLGKGLFLAPCYLAQFGDGILAVNQHQFVRCVKLISPEGEELECLYTDYTPAGMLVSGDRLLVAESSGKSIRVYDRIR